MTAQIKIFGHIKKVVTDDDKRVRQLALSGKYARPKIDNKVIGADIKTEEIELFCEWGQGIFFQNRSIERKVH